MAVKKQYTFYVLRKYHDDFKASCKEQGQTMSQVIAEYVKKRVKNYRATKKGGE